MNLQKKIPNDWASGMVEAARLVAGKIQKSGNCVILGIGVQNPYDVVRQFEKAVGEYTGAPYVVSVNSCTMAIALCVRYFVERKQAVTFEIPRKTYVSVPMQVMLNGGKVAWRDEDWSGSYQLKPYPIYDSARRFTSGMYQEGTFNCVSFHASKILGIEQGGAILHDFPMADTWFRMARFDGRTEGVAPRDDSFTMLGYHCYLSASTAAVGLLKLYSLPKQNPDLPNDEYPDLSKYDIFR